MIKPSKIKDIEIKWNNLLPFSGYIAMTFFGKMWIRNSMKRRWEFYVKTGEAAIITNHEMIHVKQAISTNDSWWKFYLLYAWYWIKANPIFNGFEFAYKMNPFEMEAFANEDVMDYVGRNTNGAARWKIYKEITTKQKKEYWKDYQTKKKTDGIMFGQYIAKYIDNIISWGNVL